MITSLPDITIDAPNVALPVGIDTFEPFPFNLKQLASINSQSPVIATFSVHGNADDSLFITGIGFSAYSENDANFGKDTQFLVYSQNDSGQYQLITADVALLKSDRAILTLPSSTMASSLRMIWAKNSYGAGTPIILNRPEIHWVGPFQDSVAAEMSIFGKNLSHNNDEVTSHIYLEKSDHSSGTWVTPTRVNPYRVRFIIPNVANGDYLVWCHNGHGGKYGWSKPSSMKVISPVAAITGTVNVKDYGATGNGTTDDTLAIAAAVQACPEWGVIYFPDGTYKVNRTDDLWYFIDGRMTNPGFHIANQRILGQSRTGTIISAGADVNRLFCAYVPEAKNITFVSNRTAPSGLDGLIRMASDIYDAPFSDMWDRYGNRVVFDNCSFIGMTTEGLNMITPQVNNVRFKNCYFEGCQVFAGGGYHIFFDNCTIKHKFDQGQFFYSPDTTGLAFEDCNSGNFGTGDDEQGQRFLALAPGWENIENIYVGNTTIVGGPRQNGPLGIQNSGELILTEGGALVPTNVVSATATTFTVSSLSNAVVSYPFDRITAVVMSGKGIGQVRKVSNVSSNTITIEEPFTIIPDNTSVIGVGKTCRRFLIYNNTISVVRYDEDYNANTPIEAFGTSIEWTVDKNVLNGSKNFILYLSTYGDGFGPSNAISVCYWNELVNNTIDKIQIAFLTQGKDDICGCFANAMRRNIFTRTLGATPNIVDNNRNPDGGTIRLCVGAPACTNSINTMIIENNNFQNSYLGVSAPLITGQNVTDTSVAGIHNVVIKSNVFNSGTWGSSGTIAIYMPRTDSTKILVYDNAFTGFGTNRSGAYSAYDLVVPQRNESVDIIQGDTLITPIKITNAGTASHTYAMSSNSPWLTVPSSVNLLPQGTTSINCTIDTSSIQGVNYADVNLGGTVYEVGANVVRRNPTTIPILVLYNINNADSLTFARGYQTAYGLDDSQLIPLNCSNEEILDSYADFYTQIEQPLEFELQGRSIEYILVGYGVPGGFTDDDDVIATASRLARIGHTYSKRTLNPLYGRKAALDEYGKLEGLIVSRIDAPSLDIALSQIRSVPTVLADGKFFFDKYAILKIPPKPFDSLLYYGKPLDIGFDNSLLMVSGNTAFWIFVPRLANLGTVEGMFDDHTKLATVAAAAWAAGYTKFIMDDEDGNFVRILNNIAVVRQAAPQMKVGVFCFPITYYNWTVEYMQSVNDQADIAAVNAAVDFAVPGTDLRWDMQLSSGRQSWLSFLKIQLAECERVMPSKPCYPFLPVDYNPVLKTDVLSVQELNWQLEQVAAFDLQPIIWGGFLQNWPPKWYSGNMISEDEQYQEDLTTFENALLPNLRMPIVKTTFFDEYTDVVVPTLVNDSFLWSFNSSVDGSTPDIGYSYFQKTQASRVFCYISDVDALSTMRDENQQRFPMVAISKGYPLTAGAMSNPTSSGFLRPQPFFDALYRGLSVGEAYTYAVPYLDWTVSLIGDPLLRVQFPAISPVSDLYSINSGWDIMVDHLASAVAYSYNSKVQLHDIMPIITNYSAENFDLFNTFAKAFANANNSWLSQYGATAKQLIAYVTQRQNTLTTPFNTYLSDRGVQISELATLPSNTMISSSLLLPEGQWTVETTLTVNGATSYFFELEVSFTDDFSSPEFALNSHIDTTGWTYEKKIGSFEDVPSGGVNYIYDTRRVRYTSSEAEYLTRGQKFYYRIRQRDSLGAYSPYVVSHGIVNT